MATAKLYLDRPKANGLHSVKIRISHLNDRKYYPTGEELTQKDFTLIEEAIKGKNLRRAEIIEVKKRLQSKLNSATEAINALNDRFSFLRYEEMLNTGKKMNDLESLFDAYIAQLKEDDRIGTALSYNNAKMSLLSYKKRLSIYDITYEFLKGYKRYMLANGKSETTIGIYLRSLRAVFNEAISRGITDMSAYPFGNSRNKFSIPSPKRRKLALSSEELLKIWNYQPLSEAEAKAKDFWFISYFGNGLNFKDIVLLRQSNFSKEEIRVVREKTKGKDQKEIAVILTDRLAECITKRRVYRIGNNPLVFDVLEDTDSPERQNNKIRQFIKTTNTHLKRIGKKLELSIPLTTYVARHSYATVAKRSGISYEAISDALGHADVKTTRNYLDSFPIEQRQQMAEKTANFGM